MSDELNRAEQLHRQALELCDQEKYKEALPLLNQTLAIAQQTQKDARPSPDLEDFGTTRTEEYIALYKRCKMLYQSIQERLEQMLSCTEQTLGSEDLETVEILHSLAELFHSQHEYTKALPLYERVLPIWEKTLVLEHPAVVQCLYPLAYLYSTQERHEEAKTLLERLLPIQEKQLGLEHPAVVRTLTSLASVHSRLEHYTQASALYERALTIQENASTPGYESTTFIVGQLAHVYQKQGEYAKALPLYERFLADFEPRVALLQEKLAAQRIPGDGLFPILQLYRKNRDICLAGAQ